MIFLNLVFPETDFMCLYKIRQFPAFLNKKRLILADIFLLTPFPNKKKRLKSSDCEGWNEIRQFPALFEKKHCILADMFKKKIPETDFGGFKLTQMISSIYARKIVWNHLILWGEMKSDDFQHFSNKNRWKSLDQKINNCQTSENIKLNFIFSYNAGFRLNFWQNFKNRWISSEIFKPKFFPEKKRLKTSDFVSKNQNQTISSGFFENQTFCFACMGLANL